MIQYPGNKNAIAHKIIPYFPIHDIYLEPFFGAGGMFFLYAAKQTLKLTAGNWKETFYNQVAMLNKKLENVKFSNKDCREFIKSYNTPDNRPNYYKRTFIYCDPPYFETNNKYVLAWSKEDFTELLDILITRGFLFAVSEFNNKEIIKEVEDRNLNIYYIGDRRNIGNRRTEILITNYKPNYSIF